MPTALHFGTCKINVHEVEHTFEPKATAPSPGAADFCLITEENLDDVADHLHSQNVTIGAGPVDRKGGWNENRGAAAAQIHLKRSCLRLISA
jgi:hypothetical protein